MCGTAGMTLGPLVAVFCFLVTHNTWTYPELTTVILAGCTVGMCNAVLTLFFVDVHPPRRARRGGTTATQSSHAAPLLPEERISSAPSPSLPSASPSSSHEPVATATPASINAATIATTSSQAAAASNDPSPPVRRLNVAVSGRERACAKPAHSRSPLISTQSAPARPRKAQGSDPAPSLLRPCQVLITVSNVFMGLGSGTLYKFIPLFCLSELHLAPITVHAIVAGMQACATVLGLLVQWLSKRWAHKVLRTPALWPPALSLQCPHPLEHPPLCP